MNAYDVIIRPVLTEKAYDGIPAKRYTFEVARNANKVEIKKAIEEIFEVKVEKVNVSTVQGKAKRQGRFEGRTPTWKKATITFLSPFGKHIGSNSALRASCSTVILTSANILIFVISQSYKAIIYTRLIFHHVLRKCMAIGCSARTAVKMWKLRIYFFYLSHHRYCLKTVLR